jgi:DNA polymerase V
MQHKKSTQRNKKNIMHNQSDVVFISNHITSPRREVPLMLSGVQAGFPSPADDSVADVLDINDLFEVDPASTFFVRAEGLSMKDAGILPGDVLCVRRDISPKNGSTVIVLINGENTVKTFVKENNTVKFVPANEDFPVIEAHEMDEITIWGVVTGLARPLWH